MTGSSPGSPLPRAVGPTVGLLLILGWWNGPSAMYEPLACQ